MKIIETDLMKEWEWETNKGLGLDPENLKCFSNKKAWWKCLKCGHKWFAPIGRRFSGSNCPCCCFPPLLPSHSRNLAVIFPEIAKQLHKTKNAIKAESVLPFSNKKMWFVCDMGHEYNMVVACRTKQGQGCPVCHHPYSKVELRLFSEFKTFFNDIKLRDKSFGFEIDLFIPSISCAIEIDGHYWHSEQIERDERKNTKALNAGLELIRIRESPLEKIGENDILYGNVVCDEDALILVKTVANVVFKIAKKPNPYLQNNVFFANDEYRRLINEMYAVPFEQSMAGKFGFLTQFWSDKNILHPDEISYGRHGNFWWKCKNGHNFKTSIWNMKAAFDRKSESQGCPYCSGMFVTKKNSLQTKADPLLLVEWNYRKNGDLTPSKLMAGSNKMVWWKCSKCGYEWEKKVQQRFLWGTPCPKCKGKI